MNVVFDVDIVMLQFGLYIIDELILRNVVVVEMLNVEVKDIDFIFLCNDLILVDIVGCEMLLKDGEVVDNIVIVDIKYLI